jgi:hypothetical protein
MQPGGDVGSQTAPERYGAYGGEVETVGLPVSRGSCEAGANVFADGTRQEIFHV